MKKVLVFLAPGFEEIEALTVVDILRRAGATVLTAGTVDGPIAGRSGIKVLSDISIDKIMNDTFDMIVLPGGGPGTENLKKDARVKKIIESHDNNKKSVIAAICAAPTVLSAIGTTKGKNVTSYPGVRGELKGEIVSDERVVVDGLVITSQSPGTAMEFSFKLVETLFGAQKAKEVNDGVLARL